jgi:hypothetical protein
MGNVRIGSVRIVVSVITLEKNPCFKCQQTLSFWDFFFWGGEWDQLTNPTERFADRWREEINARRGN